MMIEQGVRVAMAAGKDSERAREWWLDYHEIVAHLKTED